jgi:hypothetical protein
MSPERLHEGLGFAAVFLIIVERFAWIEHLAQEIWLQREMRAELDCRLGDQDLLLELDAVEPTHTDGLAKSRKRRPGLRSEVLSSIR